MISRCLRVAFEGFQLQTPPTIANFGGPWESRTPLSAPCKGGPCNLHYSPVVLVERDDIESPTYRSPRLFYQLNYLSVVARLEFDIQSQPPRVGPFYLKLSCSLPSGNDSPFGKFLATPIGLAPNINPPKWGRPILDDSVFPLSWNLVVPVGIEPTTTRL